MKILVIHNFHRKGSASGDDLVFKNETKLLEANGNEVIRFSVSNDEFDNASKLKKIRYAFGMIWSWKYYKQVTEIIKKEKPVIVHIHTFSPLLSPSIFYAVKRCNLPVIATLHDTRLVCPCATSLRENEICNLCNDGHYFRMCKYKCYKDSKIQSFIMACIYKYHRIRKTFFNQIDRYICLNDTQIDLLLVNGYKKDKIIKKYNFMEDIDWKNRNVISKELPERYVVFYGRISEEKGIRILMKAWNQIDDIPLVVMGIGSMDKEFDEWASSKSNVFFLGFTEHEKCLDIVENAEFVLFPSIWYEGCSMVMIETQCLGKSILASDIGFSSEAITDGYDGYKFTLGNDTEFTNKIRYMWSNHSLCEEMGKNARKEYERKYKPENNYLQLIDIYKDVL